MILVTGGTGLVGAHLLYNLVNNNQKVRAIYRSKAKIKHTEQVFATYNQQYQALFNLIEWVEADILDVPALTKAMENINYVYHCAAFVSFEPDKYHMLRKTNIEGTANVVNLCLALSVKKLCYVSSIATLGTPLKNKCITENTTWNPENDNSVYAITKYGAEMEVWRGTQEGLNTVIVNPGVILGAGIWKYGSGSLFKRAKKGLKYYTSGSVGLIAVQDVVCIMIELMQSNIVNSRFVLVAENWTYKRFLQALAVAVGTTPPKKTAHKSMLNIAWRLDWLKHKLTGKRRVLTKQLAKSLLTKNTYSSNKVKSTLNIEFSAIDTTITYIGECFLKTHQN